MKHFFVSFLAVFASVLSHLRASPIHGSAFPSPQETILSTTQPYLSSVAVADFDGDGFPDVLASSVGTAAVSAKIIWYHSNGDGTFAAQQNVIATFASGYFTKPFPADLDGDGKMDVAYWSDDGQIKWSRNSGGGLFDQRVIASTPYDTANQQFTSTIISVADVDGDGKQDIIAAANFPSNAVVWIRNFGVTNASLGIVDWVGPNPGVVQIPISSAGSGPTSVRANDINLDGLTDLVITSAADNTIAWLKGNGGTSFSRSSISSSQTRTRDSVIADFDGDGWQDIACAAYAANKINWFRNIHPANPLNPYFGGVTPLAATSSTPNSLGVGDFNSDGRPDIVGISFNPGKVFWCENRGGTTNFDGGLTEIYAPAAAPSNGQSVAVADFNQDGTMDVAAAWINAGTSIDSKISVYFNRGGQCVLAAVNTAPGTLMEGRKDDVLRIVVSTPLGISGDNNARPATIGLLLEKSPGQIMTTAEANTMIDSLSLYVDTNGSGALELGTDLSVGTVTDLVLASGRLSFALPGNLPISAQILPGTTRNYFVVVKAGALASSQVPNTFRLTHLGTGLGRTVLKDATTGAVLTVESVNLANTPSSLVTAQAAPPPHTYSDYIYFFFDEPSAPGSAPTDDFDLDGTLNLAEFAFGTDPTVSSAATMILSGVVPGSTIIQRGLPTISATNTGTSVDFKALFCRRKDALSGLTYTVQFASDLTATTAWESSTATPTVIADDGVIQAVSVPYPFFLSTFKKARFFRVAVTSQ